MNIQKFRSTSMRSAIVDVRRRLGADAFILHSRAVEGGVEVVAAVDYDPALFEALGGDAGTEPPRTATPEATPGVAPATSPDVADRVATPPGLATASAAGLSGSGLSGASRPGVATPESPMGRLAALAPGALRAAAPLPPERQAQERQAQGRRAAERLDDVGAELRALRGLVEGQLSGLAWQDLVRRHPQRAGVLRRLLAFGLTAQLGKSIVDALPQSAAAGALWPEALAELARRLVTGGADVAERGGVVALVGPTGVGKTTTIAKLAAACILRHGPGSVGLVTTDDFRLGAHEQLQAFGRILDIPVRHARDAAALRAAVTGLSERALVLVDTEGVGEHARRQLGLLEALDGRAGAARVYLLLAANAQRASLLRVLRAFPRERLHGCIITKLDECGSLGEALSALIAGALPLAYVSDGQQVPDDLHVMSAEALVRRGDALLMPEDDELEDEIMGLTLGRVVVSAHA